MHPDQPLAELIQIVQRLLPHQFTGDELPVHVRFARHHQQVLRFFFVRHREHRQRSVRQGTTVPDDDRSVNLDRLAGLFDHPLALHHSHPMQPQ